MRRMNRRRTNSQRKGAAVVEFAVCLPVILLIVLGSIEASSMLFLRQALVQSAYEGAKVAVRPGNTTEQAVNAATQVANGRSLENFTIQIDPQNTDDLAAGEIITVSVFAPGDENSLFPFGPFLNRTVSASATMVKE